MSKGVHDTLVYRLTEMLTKLNQGEKLDPVTLADEFGVSLRTIQRDINVRFAYLPLEKVDGRYEIDPAFLGRFTYRDIKSFADLAGVRGLFPSLSDDVLRDIFDRRLETTFLVKGHNYEDLSGKEELFNTLEKVIVENHLINFEYSKDRFLKRYEEIEPYKLLNYKGIWYLAGKDGGKLKTFSVGRIHELQTTESRFVLDSSIQDRLTKEESIWFTEKTQEVVIAVSAEAASFFKRRRLIANQVIEKELEDGSLILSAKIGHQNQILPIVRYWIPHLRIVNPLSLQQTMEREMEEYLQRQYKSTTPAKSIS
jgi:predicted DNA-binding transcriptional regulator YafY